MEAAGETELCFPELGNISCRRTVRPHHQLALIYFLLSALTVLIMALNLLVIISISHFKQLHTPTNLILLSLAAADFLVGFMVILQLLYVDGCWWFGDLTCCLHFLSYIIMSASIGSMVLISIDRYVAICYPLHYATRITTRRVTVSLCLCWSCSVLYNSLILKDNLTNPGKYKSCVGECVFVIKLVEQFADLFVTFVIPLSVIVLLYIRVFMVAASQARAMRTHVAATSRHGPAKATAKKSELKAAAVLGVVVVTFLACLCPYFCVTLTGEDTVLSALSSAFIISLFYLNSCLNPIIYVSSYPWFRKSIRLIVTLQILRQSSCQFKVL